MTPSLYAIWADITVMGGGGGGLLMVTHLCVCEQLVGIHFKINPGPVLVRRKHKLCFSCFSFVVSVFMTTHAGPAILISTGQSRSKVGHALPYFLSGPLSFRLSPTAMPERTVCVHTDCVAITTWQSGCYSIGHRV